MFSASPGLSAHALDRYSFFFPKAKGLISCLGFYSVIKLSFIDWH